MRALSLELHRGGGEAWTEEQLCDALAGLRATYPSVRKAYGPDGDHWRSDAEFFDDVRHYAGVLGPLDGEGMPWRFLHRSLREMLAAECLAEELGPEARGAVIEELMAEEGDDPRGGAGRSAEIVALLAGRLLEPGRPEGAEAVGYLRRLVQAAPDAAVRTLAGVERVDAREHLRLFREAGENAEWNNDDLDGVLDAIARSRGGERLWEEVGGAAVGELGLLWYALERVETWGRPERAWTTVERAERRERFFGACMLGVPPVITGVAIPAGEFWMGSPEGVGRDDEWPRRRVVVEAFTLGRTVVTVGEFRAFDASFEGEERMPARGVDWFTARVFAAWVGGRLPTEAEWEYACRAGTEGEWSCAEAELGEFAWYEKNSGEKVHAVREKRPNPWGLYDIQGNVFEWCESRFAPYGADAHRGPCRVLRGGSFLDVADWCRSACRGWDRPDGRLGDVGLRVVLALAPPAVDG